MSIWLSLVLACKSIPTADQTIPTEIPELPTEIAEPPTEVLLESVLHLQGTIADLDDRPAEILVFQLSPGVFGVAPADSSSGFATSVVGTAVRQGNTVVIELDPGLVDLHRHLEFHWLSFRLDLEDQDGLLSGIATVQGDYTEIQGDSIGMGLISDRFDVGQDTTGGEAELTLRQPVLPTDSLAVNLSEPIQAGVLPSIDVEGAVTVAATPWEAGLVREVLPRHEGWLPWDAAILLDTTGVVDAAGNPMSAASDRAVTPFPGLANDNLDFEFEGGWAYRLGSSEGVPGLETFDGAYGHVTNHGTLVGELAIPEASTTLSFQLAAVADFWDAFNATQVYLLTEDGDRIPVFDIIGDMGATCSDCGDWGWQLPWTEVSFDISAHQGTSVLLVLEADIPTLIGLPQGRVAIDAVTLH